MDILMCNYFQWLPEEIVLEIIYKIQDVSDLINLVLNNGKVRLVYYSNEPEIKRQLILNNIPRLIDVIDDEFTITDYSNVELKYGINRIINTIRYQSNKNSLNMIRPDEVKAYNLDFRHKLNIKFPIFYNKIKKYKFNQRSVWRYIHSRYEITFEIPGYMEIVKYLSFGNNADFLQHPIFSNGGMTKGYIFEREEFDKFVDYSIFAIIDDCNFDPEIQLESVIFDMIHMLYTNDVESYKGFVRRLSQNKKSKIIEYTKNLFNDLRRNDECDELLIDMIIDFISRC